MTREEAIAVLESDTEYMYSQDEPYDREAYRMAIEALKVEPIVRCKDCRYNYANMIPGGKGCQQNVYIEVDDNFFCADGERREDG